jgi:hypothetical protein
MEGSYEKKDAKGLAKLANALNSKREKKEGVMASKISATSSEECSRQAYRDHYAAKFSLEDNQVFPNKLHLTTQCIDYDTCGLVPWGEGQPPSFRKLSTNKAVGPDQICDSTLHELYKNKYVIAFILLWHQGKVELPNHINDSRLILLSKEKDAIATPDRTRPI